MSELFDRPFNSRKNLLSRDGILYYHGKIFNQEESIRFYELLFKEINWQPDEASASFETISAGSKQ